MADEITLESLAAKFGELNEKFNQSQEENADLKSQLAKITGDQLKQTPEAPLTVPTESFEHKGTEYKFAAAGYRRLGDGGADIVSAAEIMADSKLIEEILKIKGQGILIPQA